MELKNPQVVDFPSIQDIVLGLANLQIRRVTKSFGFKTCTFYSYETRVVIENVGEKPCHVIPGELYPKHVLVDFSVYDRYGRQCIFLPSDLNDQIVLKYFFLKIWEKNTDKHEILYKMFVKKSPSLKKQSLQDILSSKFEGRLYSESLAAMWGPAEKSIKQILATPLKDYIDEQDRSKFKQFTDLRIRDLCDDELTEFAERLDSHFLQLVQLNEAVPPREHTEIILKDNKFIQEDHQTQLRKSLLGSVSYQVDLSMNVILPHQEKTTFHIKITPPEGVKIDLKSGIISYLARKSRFLFLWKNQRIDPKKFSIIHPKQKHDGCDSLLEELKIQKKEFSVKKLFEEKQPSEDNSEFLNVNAQLQEDMIFLYFGGRDQTRVCDRSHRLLFNFDLKRNAIRIYHLANILLWLLMLPLTFLLMWNTTLYNLGFVSIQSAPYSILNQYFWSSILMLLGQSIAALVDYSRRPTSERFFLDRTFKGILILTIIEFLLLVVLPFILPSIATSLLDP